MKKLLGRITIWTLILVATGCLDIILNRPKQFIAQISPMSLFRLPSDYIMALGLTFSTSFVAWILGIVIGYVFGYFAAFTAINNKKDLNLSSIGKLIDKIFEWIYIIPFVLTTSFAYALVQKLHVNYGFPKIFCFISMAAVAGIALGGYHIFKSIVDSVQNAKINDYLLTESLYYEQRFRILNKPRLKIKKLLDCRIHTYCSSLRIAFHLSIVGVMIVEALTPHLYEFLWPSSGFTVNWTKGLGRLITSANNNYDYDVMAGSIWAVLLLDSFFVHILDIILKHKWLKYYRGDK